MSEIHGTFGYDNHHISFDIEKREGQLTIQRGACSCPVYVGINTSGDCTRIASVLAEALLGNRAAEVKDNGAIVQARMVQNSDGKPVIEIKNSSNESTTISKEEAREAINVLNGVAKRI